MRVLVFSDSHGRVLPMEDAVRQYAPQGIFHLGDVAADGEALGAEVPLPLYQVRGNCDLGRPDLETERLARLEGKTVLYLHGHTYGVKTGLSAALDRAFTLKADLLLFGHTHRPFLERFGTVLAVNPGAVLQGSAALLTWSADTPVEVAFLEL